MAATPSKLSPSSRPVKGDEDATNTAETTITTATATETEASSSSSQSAPTKVPPKSDNDASKTLKPAPVVCNLKPAPPFAAQVVDLVTNVASAASQPPLEPSYESSEASGYYITAKAFLNGGDFEQALTTIEEGIQETRNLLSNQGIEDSNTVLHPSMGPFHYLYGTTLLYSIEESNDGQAMTTTEESAAAAAVAASAAAADGDGGDDDYDGPEEYAAQPESAEEDNADDMQIAFENLDTARLILEDYMKLENKKSDEKLKLDLAQIYLREGDLHRLNGRYDAAVCDYGHALRYRQETPSLLGPYDRKIADVHYNLALTYSLALAEAATPQQQQQDDNDDDKQKPSPNDEQNYVAKLADYKRKSFHHYLACGKTLCGQLAILALKDPEELLQKADKDIAGFKTTGEEEEDESSSSVLYDHPETVSLKLQSLRKVVSDLIPPSDNQELFQSLFDLIQEIQETIDEAETSQEAVHQVSELKAEITAAASAACDQSEGMGGGVTSTIGFGSAAATVTAAASTVATNSDFGSAATAASAAAAAGPVMMVRKKQKRDVEDAKLPALNIDPSKMPKSE